MKIFIYGLVCPVSGVVRYVGKSTNPEKRLRGHLCAARCGAYNHHTARWLRSLGEQEPAIVILHEVCEGERWQDVERAFIATAADRGWKLTNSTAGGEGLDYLNPEDEARYRENLSRGMAAYSRTQKGRARLMKMVSAALEPEALERRNRAIRSAYQRPDVFARHSAASKEVNARPEVKASRSESGKAMWLDPDKRRRILDAYASPETKAKQSARKRASWADPVTGAKMRAIHSSEETRRKKSEAAHRRATPEYRAMMAEKTRLSWERRRKGN